MASADSTAADLEKLKGCSAVAPRYAFRNKRLMRLLKLVSEGVDSTLNGAHAEEGSDDEEEAAGAVETGGRATQRSDD
jgi:hypothetical protein